MGVSYLIFLFVLGILFLYIGAEGLVRGSVRLSRMLGVSSLIMGLTVVAFGTSAPEFMVSFLAALQKSQDISIANIIGSNCANIGLIIGVSALIQPLYVNRQILVKESPLMIFSSLLVLAFFYDLYFAAWEGLCLIICLVAYLVYLAKIGSSGQDAATTEDGAEIVESHVSESPISILKSIEGSGSITQIFILNVGVTLAGILMLSLGSYWLIRAARGMAEIMGISDLAIGASVVAIGTSLPELATSVVSAIRREADIAIGNVVGSNLFNLLFVLGTVGVVSPLPIDKHVVTRLLPIMIAFTVVYVFFMVTRKRVVRWEAGVLLVGYVVFMVYLF